MFPLRYKEWEIWEVEQLFFVMKLQLGKTMKVYCPKEVSK